MLQPTIDPFIDSPLVIERGENPNVLVIAFSGFAGQLMMHPFEFFAVSATLKYSRILLRDTSNTCYLTGLPPLARSYEALIDLLSEAIADLAPKTTIVIGTSGGGTAALLIGYQLKADYVHAFSPFTYADKGNLERLQDEDLLARREVLLRLWALPEDNQKLLDVGKVLKISNGKTCYNVHVCGGNKWDLTRAQHVSKCPLLTVSISPAVRTGIASAGLVTGVEGSARSFEHGAQPERGGAPPRSGGTGRGEPETTRIGS